jgi:S-adenosylmethionine:tRNA ribosyltransferase-isomerase
MKAEEFDYELPEELIAQEPVEKRDECRLMVLDREKKSIEHRKFYDILDYIDSGDLLVLNDSKVIPARIFGVKANTGGHVEFLLSRKIGGDVWETLVRPGRRLKEGDRVIFSEEAGKSLSAEIMSYGKDGTRIVRFSHEGLLSDRLEELGSMPLPTYIARPAKNEDKENYQTVYCKHEGSVASPTAGLHFTEELLDEAGEKGIGTAYLTLHVGIGTFRPVKSERIEDHHMHFEHYSISDEAAKKINETILRGGKIISVGTTSTRTLESAAYFDGKSGRYLVKAGEADTGIFIYPGYEFKIIDRLITNFHLPKSTLIMLVSALYDKDEVLKAYREAVRMRYRFFSYGDAMLIK